MLLSCKPASNKNFKWYVIEFNNYEIADEFSFHDVNHIFLLLHPILYHFGCPFLCLVLFRLYLSTCFFPCLLAFSLSLSDYASVSPPSSVFFVPSSLSFSLFLSLSLSLPPSLSLSHLHNLFLLCTICLNSPSLPFFVVKLCLF